MRLSHLTWPEAEEALRRAPVVLIPLGAAAKEHGPHLPLDTDLILAEGLAARVEERTEVLVAPTVTYSFYPAFREYPGSVCLEPSTCQAWMVEIVRSLAAHGARRFYVLNTGISTNRFLVPTREALRDVLFDFTDLAAALPVLEGGLAEQEGGTHADEIETSMILHLAPERVRMERAVKDYHPGTGPLTRDPRGKGVYSASGIFGDPTLATAEKGRIVVARLVDHLVRDVERLASR